MAHGFKNGDEVIITHFESILDISIRKAKKNEAFDDNVPEIYHMLEKMLQNTDTIQVQNIQMGSIVKVFVTEFGIFCRGFILDIININDYDVLLMDYGQRKNYPLLHIYELEESLKIFPHTVRSVGMLDYAQQEYKYGAGIVDYFKTFEHKLLVLEFDEDDRNLENVIFKNPRDGSCIDFRPKIKSGDLCMVTKAYDWTRIYVTNTRLNDETDQIEAKSLEMTIKMSRNTAEKIRKDKPRLGNIVQVYSQELEMFVRARIIKIINANECVVFYMDFGHEKQVLFRDIFKLDEELKNEPYSCFSVGMIDTSRRTAFNSEVERIFDGLQSQILMIELNGDCGEDLKNVKFKHYPYRSYITFHHSETENPNSPVNRERSAVEKLSILKAKRVKMNIQQEKTLFNLRKEKIKIKIEIAKTKLHNLRNQPNA